jgi:23S rRNA (cytidine2498-2'-O)-methyltransferase
LPADFARPDRFELNSVFARASGFSLGRVRGASPDELAKQVWPLTGGRTFDRLHVWSRDARAAGDRGYLPGPVAADAEAARAIVAQSATAASSQLLAPTRSGDLILDCVIVENASVAANGQQPTEAEWYLGYHRATGITSCQPGGMGPIELPEHAVSRAYLKLQEGLRWSQLPLKAGERCSEIGAAPGGASQALLERGLYVTGIDPAEIDRRVLEHPNFVHIRKRGSEVRRREFRKTRWLLADLNVAPQYTLDTVEAIALHEEVELRGLLLTLKLLDWNLADEIPAYLERIRSWGFNSVRARQLQTSRQEICVAAQFEKPAGTRRRKAFDGRRRA